MGRSIFSELNDAILNVKDEYRLKVLYKIRDYILSGVWERKAGGSKPVLDVLGMKRAEACKKYNMTESCYKIRMKRASDRIRELLGEELISDIRYGDADKVSDALIQFNLRTKCSKVSTYLISEVIEECGECVPKMEYNIEELESEIGFLSVMTKGSVRDMIEDLDRDKIAYILKVLGSSDSSHMRVRATLFKDIVMSTKGNIDYIQNE